MPLSEVPFPGNIEGADNRSRSSSLRSRSRSNSDVSDYSRESFIDNLPARGSFSFKAQIVKEEKRKAEDQRFDKYRRKLKWLSMFFVSLSVFVLINASIGASSAPFYDKYTDCSKY